VSASDLVLVPGDISMAQNHRDVQLDLAWLDRLPGTKVLAPGNHDRWWNSLEHVRPLLRRSQLAVCGDAVTTHNVVICGAAGERVPPDDPTPEERASAERAIHVLSNALDAAARMRTRPHQPIYVMWHRPPFDAHARPGPWVELFERAGVTACVYGHLHIEGQWGHAVQGLIRGVRYYCVAADAVGFHPFRIGSLPLHPRVS
jgi:predicted phosphohydrolase